MLSLRVRRLGFDLSKICYRPVGNAFTCFFYYTVVLRHPASSSCKTTTKVYPPVIMATINVTTDHITFITSPLHKVHFST